MHELQPTLVEPTTVPVEKLVHPDPLDLSFDGFSNEAFAILERLREHPRIEQYRQEKAGIEKHIKEPFRSYRDDLVLNWVLPNRLRFETEKHVFSRLLKNDFGAGGCHHHKWMAFYRPGRRRLTDLQITHSLFPHSFRVGLFVGGYGKDLLEQARDRIDEDSARFLALVNPLLDEEGWKLYYERGSGKNAEKHWHTEPMAAVPEGIYKASSIWIRRFFDRDDVLERKDAIVAGALKTVRAVWPLYRFLGAE